MAIAVAVAWPGIAVAELLATNLSLSVVRLPERYADPNLEPSGQNLTFQQRDWRDDLILPTDISADKKPTTAKSPLRVGIQIDEQGKSRSCRVIVPSAVPDFDKRGCDLLLAHAFSPTFISPLEAVAVEQFFEGHWMRASEFGGRAGGAGGPATTAWPRMWWAKQVVLTEYPDVGAFFPSASKRPTRNISTSADIVFVASKGFDRCTVGVSSGDAQLDAAACEVGKQLKLKYRTPCTLCDAGPVPIKVVWGPRQSYLVFPNGGRPIGTSQTERRDPHDPVQVDPCATTCPTRVTWREHAPDGRDFPDSLVADTKAKQVILSVKYDAKGRPTGCAVALTSGVPAVDDRACQTVERRARFSPAHDVFGDIGAAESIIRVGWKSLRDRFMLPNTVPANDAILNAH